MERGKYDIIMNDGNFFWKAPWEPGTDDDESWSGDSEEDGYSGDDDPEDDESSSASSMGYGKQRPKISSLTDGKSPLRSNNEDDKLMSMDLSSPFSRDNLDSEGQTPLPAKIPRKIPIKSKGRKHQRPKPKKPNQKATPNSQSPTPSREKTESWVSDSSDPQTESDWGEFYLENINFKAKRGQLIMIVGKVASGKSSLLYALQGEMSLTPSSHSPSKTVPIESPTPPSKSSLSINPNIAFLAQAPFLFSKSVKDNICLSKPFNEKKFNGAIAAAGLGLDVGIWTDGIDTNVGEGGSRLSGGQKARVGLAMCIYQEPEILLLDDPIAALDAKLAKFVMEETLVRGLKGKTRVVVTHSTQFLKLADYVYVMDQGRIVRKGTYQELYEDKLIKKISELSLQREISLRHTESLKVHQEIESPSLGNDADLAGRPGKKFSNSKHGHSRKSSLVNRKVSFEKERRASKAWSETENLTDADENQAFVNKYFKEECQESETGHVSWKTVKTLIEQSGGLLTIVFIIVMCQVGALVEMYYYQYIFSWTRAFEPETQWHSLKILFWIGFGWATMIIIKSGFTSFLTVH